jgi:catechol 2,3-dioxygenase-like lactoylglutathione lyase family enzyme
VCVRVTDLPGAYRKLAAKGVDFLTEPLTIAQGPNAGRTIVYFRDPDDFTLELLEDANEPGVGG